MPMTSAEWGTWSVEKRKFYAELFTCYQMQDDELCIDAAKRQQLVRQQLSKQAANKDAERVINSNKLANYILVGNLLKDDKLKSVEDDITILYLQRKPLAPPFSGLGVQKAELPVQNTFVGGFRSSEQEVSVHFAKVIKQKMSNDEGTTASTIAKRATCVLLGEIDDLTFVSRCALDKEESLFLIKEPEFISAIGKQAQGLLLAKKLSCSAEELSKKIACHISVYSDQTSEQVSLASLSIPTVNTYAAFYPEKFSQIWTYVKDIETRKNESDKEGWCFKPGFASLVDCLIKGPLEFAFQSEYIMLVKLALLLGSLAGKSFDEMRANFQNPIDITNPEIPALSAMLGNIAEAQIANIRELVLPPPPFFMGIIWKSDRPDFILEILKSMYYFDLYSIAQMMGIPQKEAHLAYGLESQALLIELNRSVSLIWEMNSQVLLGTIPRFLEQQCPQERVLKFAGADLDSKPIPAASAPAKGPGAHGVFYHADAAPPVEHSVGEVAKAKGKPVSLDNSEHAMSPT